jgi:hypothetical protein
MNKKNIFLLFLTFSSFQLFADRAGRQVRPNPVQHALPSYQEFKKVIHDFKVTSHEHLRSAPWLSQGNPFIQRKITSFTPFAQKLSVPHGSEIAFFGDLHGNKKALDECILALQRDGYIDQNLVITKPQFYCIFLGDYVDRGPSGVEVLSTILTLKLRNPRSVFLVRGNHEDRLLNTVYGFKSELRTKFPEITDDELNAVFDIYEYMPTVLYLGSGDYHDFIQCCHGGIEIGYNPYRLLADTHPNTYHALPLIERVEAVRELPPHLKQDVIKNIPEHEICNFKPVLPTNPVTLGFLWNDFIERQENYRSPVVDYHPGRGWVFGQKLTEYMLTRINAHDIKLRAIFRAHQHHGGMLTLLEENKGIMPLWDFKVVTFLTAPFPNLKFSSVSFGILKTARRYEDWALEHIVL